MPFDQSGNIHEEVRLAIDNTNTDKIQQLFNDYPDLDWNHITPNGLSALWWALTPPRGKKINPDFVSFLLELKRSDQRAINASQQYANLRPDNYIEKFIPKELCNGGLASLISIIRNAQDNTPPDNTTNQILIRASDRVRGLNLLGVDFRGCNLSGIDFRGVNLTNADLRLIHAKDTQWEGCNLSGAEFNQFIFIEALLGSTHCTKELLAKTNNENDDALRLALGRNNNYNYHNIKAIISSPHCTAEMLKSRSFPVLHALATGDWFRGMTTNERAELFKIILNSEYCTEDLLATSLGNTLHPTLLHCVVYDTLHGWYDLSILQMILASKHCTDKVLEIKDTHGRTPLQIAIRDHCHHDNEETKKRCSEIIALFNNMKKTTDNLKKEKTLENTKKDLINVASGEKPEEPKANFNDVIKIRTEACNVYLRHLHEAINKFTFLQGSHSIALAEEKIKKVTQLKMILTSNISPADKVKNFDDSLKKESEYLIKLLKKHRDNYLITFLKCLGVIGAAILGLAGFGIGAFFAGRLAKEKLFNVKGEEFIKKVSVRNP